MKSDTKTISFRCDSGTLSDSLGVAFRASPSKAALAAPAGVLVCAEETGRLVLSATDGELTIETSLPAEVSIPGEVVLHRIFGDIIRSLPEGAVEILVDGDGIATVSSGRSHFSLRTYQREDFPVLPKITEEFTEISSPGLCQKIEQTVIAASSDKSRPVLTGVLLQKTEKGTRLVATDSYRLVVNEIEQQDLLGDEKQILLSARALAEVARLSQGESDAIGMVISTQKISFRVGTTTVTTGFIEGNFPNYEQLIPDQMENRLEIEKTAFLDALRRVGLLARDSTPVRLLLSEDLVRLQAIDPELGGEADEEVEGIYTGEEMTIAFNPGFLRNGFEACEADKILIEMTAPLKPAVISEYASRSFMYLLMPVRV